MKVLGADCSSSRTGITILEDGKVIHSDIWVPINKKASADRRLFEYYQWIGEKLYKYRPDLVVVSSTSFSRNARTTRVLARYEAATIISARIYSCNVLELRDSEARKLILSRGNLSKEEAYQEALMLEPNYKFLPYKEGGNDQTDAYVFARAGMLLADAK